MTEHPPPTRRLRLSDLPGRKPTRFDLAPDAAARAAIAAQLDLTDLPALSLRGQIAPMGRRDWRLTARLVATAVQPCVVTLAPVTTRIDEEIERLYLADFTAPEGDEIEMPDERAEPLPEMLDLDEVMTEALALALPPFPRSDSAAIEPAPDTGTEPPEPTQRPFAGLDKLLRAGRDEDGSEG